MSKQRAALHVLRKLKNRVINVHGGRRISGQNISEKNVAGGGRLILLGELSLSLCTSSYRIGS